MIKQMWTLMGAWMMAVVTGAHAQSLAVDAPDDAWRALDPEQTLYIDLPNGRVVIEMFPEYAAAHVERMKTFARQGFYKGVVFHRVIPGFMAQGGDPTGTGRGASDLPNLPLEAERQDAEPPFTADFGQGLRAQRAGYLRSAPVYAEAPAADGAASWISHCRGVVSMARKSFPQDSANSQFFVMLDANQHLDRGYSAWGRVLAGMEHVDAIAVGEPPSHPTAIVATHVAADIAEGERVALEVLKTDSEAFRAYLSQNAVVDPTDVCGADIPVRLKD